MTLSRSRKLVLAILAVAVTALAVDRLVLAPSAGGPTAAQAAPGRDESPAGAGEASATTPPTAPPVDPRPRLADRLQVVAEHFELDPDGLRDGFVPAEAWLADLVEPPPEPEAPEPQASPATRFAEQHTLTSVILTSGGGSAVIDGKVVPLGQTIEEFRLIRLTRHSAVFEAGGETVELRLQR